MAAPRCAMISARFDGGEMEAKMRAVHRLLQDQGHQVFMVDVAAGDSFAELTARYLNRIRREKGLLLAVCTANYGEVTSSTSSTFEELLYCDQYGIPIVPLRMVETYPPEPPFGPKHPFDKEGKGESMVMKAMKPGTKYEDVRGCGPGEIAGRIAKLLGGGAVAAESPGASIAVSDAGGAVAAKSPGASIAVSGAENGLRVWDLQTGQCLRSIDAGEVCCVALQGSIGVCGGEELFVFNWQTGELRSLCGHEGGILCVALQGSVAVTGSDDKTLRVWDWQTSACHQILEGHRDPVCSVALQEMIAVSASFDNLRVWDWRKGQYLRSMRADGDAVALQGPMAVSAGSANGFLHVWDWMTGKCVRRLKGHSNFATCVALQGGKAVSGSHDTTLRVWDCQTGECRLSLLGHKDWVTCVALQGSTAVSGSTDKTLRVWDWQTGECHQILKGHKAWVTCVALVEDIEHIEDSEDCF